MLEILGDSVTLFEVHKLGQGEALSKVENIKNLTLAPMNLAEYDATILYNLFSPDLREFVDINLKEQSWIVRQTCNPDGPTYKIPNSILPLPTQENYQCMLAKFIAWYDKNHIRAIDARNKEKIEIIFKLPGQPESRDQNG